MKGAKSLLDSLLQSGGEMGKKAKETWDEQSTGTKGAVAGGLLGVLLGGGGRGGLGGVARVGGAALIGSLVSKAYADWQAGKLGAGGDDAMSGLIADQSDDHATRLLQAMIAAAKADGHVTDEERARISGQLLKLGLGDDARAMIETELAAPLDVGRVADLAKSPEEAAELYAASLLVVDREGAAEQGYLAMLAARMRLDPALVAQLHARVETLA